MIGCHPVSAVDMTTVVLCRAVANLKNNLEAPHFKV